MNNNAVRWGLVTACIGLTCGTLGHFVDGDDAAVVVILVAVVGAMIGSFAISGEVPV